MYGIQDETGNVMCGTTASCSGAIDVAMFVLIIGGFLGVTMKTAPSTPALPGWWKS